MKFLNLRPESTGEISPLHYASLRGNIRIMKLLVEVGADVDARDESQMTPINWAFSHGRREIIKVLKETGAVE